MFSGYSEVLRLPTHKEVHSQSFEGKTKNTEWWYTHFLNLSASMIFLAEPGVLLSRPSQGTSTSLLRAEIKIQGSCKKQK